jgi:hypothetical protein
VQRYGADQINGAKVIGLHQVNCKMLAHFSAQFFHPPVFEVVYQPLVLAAFGEKEKGSGKFDSDPAVKKLGYGVLGNLVKIGAGNMVQTMQADPLFLFNELVATDDTQARENQFSQVIQKP